MLLFDNLALFLIRADYRVRNLLLRVVARLLFRPAPSRSSIRSILLFRTGSLGDSICALPAIDAIRRNFPDAAIDILTNAGSNSYISLKGVLRQAAARDIIDYLNTPRRELFAILKEKRYDLFIELPQYDAPLCRQIRNMLVVKALGISPAFGWRLSSTLLFPGVQERNLEFPNDTDRLLGILRENGLDVSSAGYIHPLTPEKIEELERHPVIQEIKGDRLIAVGIGGNDERKFWGTEKCAHVARHFQGQGFRCVLLGGQADHARGEEILSGASGIRNLCGALSPLESMAVIRNCHLVISNDTGTLHMAYAVGAPVIGIYTARDYVGKWYPPKDSPHAVFRLSGIPCAVCLRRGKNLPCSDNICIQRISAEEVIAAGERLLSEPQVPVSMPCSGWPCRPGCP